MGKLSRLVAVLLVVVLLSLSATALASSPFVYEDLCVDTLMPGMTSEQVQAVLGVAPTIQTTEPEAATGDVPTEWSYTGLTLVFIQNRLTRATITGETYTSARGLKIGDPESMLLDAFGYDAQPQHEGVLYAADWLASLTLPVPPSGQVTTTEGSPTLYQYLAPVTPYPQTILDDPESLLFENHAIFNVYVNTDTHTITQIAWSVQALSE